MKPRNKKILLLLAEIFFYCLGGMALFHVLWLLVQDVNSTDLAGISSYPFYFVCLIPLYIAFAFQAIRHPADEKGKKTALIVHGAILSGVSFLSLLLDFIFLGAGIYPSLIIHRYGPLFPLSAILFSVLSLLIGIAFLLFGTKFFSFSESEACPKRKYLIPSRILLSVYAVFGAGFCGDFLLFPAMMDYSGDNFFLCLPVFALMILPSIVLLRREISLTFFPKEKAQLLELRFLCAEGGAGVFFAAWMAIALSCKSSFIVESMTSFFPIDFMGSMAIGPYVLFFLNLLYPLGAFLFYLKRPVE